MSDIGFVKRVIQAHCAEIHSIKDLARFTDYSAETIRKDFVRLEHVTLSEYISRTRVGEAKHLLETTDMTCQEISDAVGFSRADVGARAFKQFTGRTMGEYRNHSRHKMFRRSRQSNLQAFSRNNTAKVNR
jgi:transcriptional regulator GlxA family with amidase domain